MPYGIVNVNQTGNTVTIVIELPEQGEQSNSGRAENMVDLGKWFDFEHGTDRLCVKMTVCRPYRHHRSSARHLFLQSYPLSPR
jgi:hypothetical protein